MFGQGMSGAIGSRFAARRLARSALGLSLASSVAFAGLAAAPAPAQAAVGGYQISVTCDNLAKAMDFGVTVYPSPGYTKQRIWFQFAMWDVTRNQQVSGYWPGRWLYLDYQKYWPNGRIENSVSSPMYRHNLPSGTYKVWAQFAFEQVNGTADYTGWIQATVQNYGGGFHPTCNL
jgi:hypothetical protein